MVDNVPFSAAAPHAHNNNNKMFPFHYNVQSHKDLLILFLLHGGNITLRYLNMLSIILGSIFHLFELLGPLFLS